MKNTTLYLLSGERVTWEALSDERKEGWTVKDETGTAFESADVLKIRAGMARFESFPELREVTKKVMAGEKPDLSILERMPEAILPELCFTIGARGVTALIAAQFKTLEKDDDIAALAGLTSIRHDILTTNASVTAPLR